MTPRLPAILLCGLLCGPTPATAQLRPLEPFDWEVFEPGHRLSAEIGAGLYQHQRASLAGTVGRLREYGSFRAVWRSGRVALEASGTLVRVFDDQGVFAAPTGGARDLPGTRRRDTGDFRVATLVRLTPPGHPAGLALRFGTRLPTTDNEVGLERDRTDFFALLGGRLQHAGLSLSAETGLGIFGTRDLEFEQSDVWLFALSGEYDAGPVTPSLSLVGHRDGLRGWAIRGNEELAELRAGLRVGGRYWVRAEWVHGLTEFSPRGGAQLSIGTTR